MENEETVVLERGEFEPNLEPSDINDTEVLDVVPDSCEYATADITDDFVKDIVLDSDEEGADAVGSGSSLKEMEETRCKWKLNTLGKPIHSSIASDAMSILMLL